MYHRLDEILLQQKENIEKVRESGYPEQVSHAVRLQLEALRQGNKILIAGNGGSAADAQHLAGELVGRFLKERKGLGAVALSTDTSILTSVGNDYGYGEIFARQVEALGRPGDVFLGISTSGNSENIIKAVKKARELGLVTVCLTGRDGGELKELCDCNMVVPLEETPRIQEFHTMTVHMMCELVEEGMAESQFEEMAGKL